MTTPDKSRVPEEGACEPVVAALRTRVSFAWGAPLKLRCTVWSVESPMGMSADFRKSEDCHKTPDLNKTYNNTSVMKNDAVTAITINRLRFGRAPLESDFAPAAPPPGPPRTDEPVPGR